MTGLFQYAGSAWFRFKPACTAMVSCNLLIGVLFGAAKLFGQTLSPYSFITLGKEQGLQNLKTTALFQDSYGFVWLGTQGGLFRYEGYRFVQYENIPGDQSSLPSNFIAYRGMLENPEGDLWIATNDAGIVKFDRRSERFLDAKRQENTGKGLSFNGISALCLDEDTGFWIATMGKGLNRYFPKQDSFCHYILPDNRFDTLMGSNLVLSLLVDREKRLWIGTDRGAAVLHPNGTFERFFPDSGNPGCLSAGFVYDIFQDKSGKIWLATQNGLNSWNPSGSFTRYYPQTKIPGIGTYNCIYRVLEDQDGQFWLGTKGGLVTFDPLLRHFTPVIHHPNDPNAIPNGAVHGIMQDQAGNLWFATNEGVAVLDKRTVLFRAEKWLLEQVLALSESPRDGVVDMVQAGDRLWFSTEAGLFTCRKGEPLKPFLSGSFTKLCTDRQGNLYAGTLSDHFYYIDPVALRVIKKIPKDLQRQYNPNQAVGWQISCIAEDATGHLWVGTKSGLNRYDPAADRWYQYYATSGNKKGIPSSVINDLYSDRKGNLWIATNDGVCQMTYQALLAPVDPSSLPIALFQHLPNDQNSLGNNRVRAILEDRKGWLWFGTDVGLHALQSDGHWSRFFRAQGLPDNKTTGLIEDAQGNIWVSTADNGLVKYDQTTNRFFAFTKQDGLYTNQFPSGACIKLNDGKLFFAGFQGANCFSPEKLLLPAQESRLYFTEFRLANHPVEIRGKSSPLQAPPYMTSHIDLEFGQKVLSFHFAALNYTHPEKQIYRYRLFPLQTEWQSNGSKQEISFVNLDHGDYQLQVETSADGYEWTGQTLYLRIFPPWYRSWLAYLGYVLCLALILYAVRRYDLKRQLAKAEAERLKELDSLKTQLYTNITHEFRTPLTVILGETAQLEAQGGARHQPGLSAIRRQGRHLLRLVNQMLDLAKVEAGSMKINVVQDNVVLFLKYLLETFHSLADNRKIKLHFESDADEFQMDFDPDKLQEIVSNLLSNALKFTSQGGTITLRVQTGASLVLEVGDTGRGISPEKLPYIFDRFYQADDSMTRPGEGTGIGLTLIKELVQLLGGQIEVESRPGEGTTFRVRLPVTRNAARKETVQAFENQGMMPEISTPAPVFPISVSGIKPDRARLLLVEDNPDVSRYIQGLLHTDYEIITEGNGSKGLESAFRFVPDIIISDVMMPEMDGFELCRRLKTDERTSHIPVVLLTAKADQPSKIEGLRYGADDYLSKPFHPEELFVRLEKLIVLRRRLQERFSRFVSNLKIDKSATDKS
ncbi:MAG: response regulator, partial [Saprospiraceae bacterium]|nr:response regulator [Saprospiraceae bacterium]